MKEHIFVCIQINTATSACHVSAIENELLCLCMSISCLLYIRLLVHEELAVDYYCAKYFNTLPRIMMGYIFMYWNEPMPWTQPLLLR